MILNFQKESIEELTNLAKSDRHSLLIEGPSGCGKSYLAKQYAMMLGVSDFASVNPTVPAIRETIDASYNLTSPVVFCIENLDAGVAGASYTLLKFLEEPSKNVYLVVTCRNRYKVPDTIISRSACISMSAPIESDIKDYAEIKDAARYNLMKSYDVWKAVRTLKDVDNVLHFNQTQIDYFSEIKEACTFKDSVANLSWKLGHYNDNSETDIPFVINYIIQVCNSSRIQKHGISCIKDLTSARIASHAVLAKFIFECKYGG